MIRHLKTEKKIHKKGRTSLAVKAVTAAAALAIAGTLAPMTVLADTDTLVSDENGTRCVDENGEYAYSSWRQVNGQWYWFNKSGYLVDDHTDEAGTYKGVDVSQWNGSIDWPSVAADGISFAFIRAASDFNYEDPNFYENMQGAGAAGLARGIYYYSVATDTSRAVADADFLVSLLQKYGFSVEMPLVIDLEDEVQMGLSADQITAIAQAFCGEVAAYGYTPMVYVNENWAWSYINLDAVSAYKWVAAWSLYTDSTSRQIWQSSNNGRVNGIHGNVDIDFSYVDPRSLTGSGTTNVSSASTGQQSQQGWSKDSSGAWSYYNSDGSQARGWQKVGDSWYYMDGNGIMQTGWANVNGTYYYLNSDGSMRIGWLKDGDSWYYLDGSGAMRTGWVSADNKYYYLKSGGAMQTGWLKDGNTWYYLDGSGVMQTGWVKVDDRWYYLQGSGAMATGWAQVDGKWYFLNESGAMQTGWLKVYDKWYFLNENGAMQTGWLQKDGNWYYLGSDGAMVTGNQQVGGDYYYFAENGVMQNEQE